MVTIPTVLVLGAGASAPYYYPTGENLKTGIINDLSGGNNVKVEQIMRIMGDFGVMLRKFIDDFRTSPRSSIDAFLESRPEYIDVGKLAIAQALIELEKEENLISVNDWYQYLFNELGNSFDQFDKNKLSIITFNYDRSLETFLSNALQSTFGKSEVEAAEKIQNMKILHMYGQIGLLPLQTNGYTRKYDPMVDDDQLKSSSDGIKIIHEEKSAELFEDAYNLLKNANKIYFLGFGYHKTNLQRLQINKLVDVDKIISGTCKGLTKRRMEEIQTLSGNRINFNFNLSHLKIKEYLDEIVTFE